MKSWLLSLGSIALAGSLLFATGCTKDPEQYTVTFKQAGEADLVYTVDAGSDMDRLPTPKDVTGYTVNWDRTELKNITEDVIVNAVATPNQYTITYTEEEGVTLDAYTQTVTYDAQYELKTPTKEGSHFDGWYNGTTLVEQSGVWKIADDVTLTALWTAETSEVYEIKFIHADGSEETVEVAKGTTLSADLVPTCKQITGYTVAWEVTDFSTITSGRIVNAVKTAKTYQITYQSAEGVTNPATNPTTIKYGDSYTLEDARHSNSNKFFIGWETAMGVEVKSSGVWEIDSDVVLVAIWGDAASDKDWTGNH